jgi:hypothetical protein
MLPGIGLVGKFFLSAPNSAAKPAAARVADVGAEIAARLSVLVAECEKTSHLRAQLHALDVESGPLAVSAAMGSATAQAKALESTARMEAITRELAMSIKVCSELEKQIESLKRDQAALEVEQLRDELGAAIVEEADAARAADTAGQAFAASMRRWMECDMKVAHLRSRLQPGRNSLSLIFRLEHALSFLFVPQLPAGVAGVELSTTAARKRFTFEALTPSADDKVQK